MFSSILAVAVVILIISIFLKLLPLIIISIIAVVFISLWFNHYSHVSNYYHFEDPKINELKARIAKVIPEIDKIKIYGSNKSFTIDKRTAYICVKDDNGSYYEDNMLVYVILHELAHAITRGKGHNEEWENNFDKLLERAAKGGIFDPTIPLVDGYCGY